MNFFFLCFCVKYLPMISFLYFVSLFYLYYFVALFYFFYFISFLYLFYLLWLFIYMYVCMYVYVCIYFYVSMLCGVVCVHSNIGISHTVSMLYTMLFQMLHVQVHLIHFSRYLALKMVVVKYILYAFPFLFYSPCYS